jgi:hypothetical protein
MNIWSKMHVRGLCTALGALLLCGVGCELVSTVDRSIIGGTGGSGGSGTTSSTGGSGGTGGSPECTAASECPDPGNECLERACTAEGKCEPTPLAAGSAVADQTAGDCQKVVCDGNGATTGEADDADIPVDGNECTADACTAGVPSNPPVALDTPCGAGGALHCDGAGQCVGCTADAHCGAPTDCATPHCVTGACAVDFTAPGTPVPTQVEGDCLEVQCDGLGGTKAVGASGDVVDDGNPCTDDLCAGGAATHPNSASGKACAMGGTVCNGAGACVGCVNGSDCTSFVCTAQVCAAATCTDNVKNGTEVDIDCGGADCAPCADGKLCGAASDCASSVCSGNPLNCQAPLCTDTVKNGSESDVDCGGATCAKCGPTKACAADGDCLGGSCVGNTCVPTCTDTVKNGTESDVDCGGTCAAKCATDKACGAAVDCTSSVCTGNVCQAPTCSDTVKNGGEGDVDCGGSCAVKCASGKTCGAAGDCESGVCSAGVCAAPACNDAVKNGTETDLDCGGTCPGCVDGKVCSLNGDCQNGACLAGICGVPTCVDNSKNGAETDVDCGGPTCPDCAVGKTCSAGDDCTTGTCTAGVCAPPPLDNEPANNACAGASAGQLATLLSPLAMPNIADQDWFVFTATAADVGKKVRVKATSVGQPPCDPVVEVFTGSCAALVTLGGPSDDLNYSENWLTPVTIPAAGSFWVQVTYSSFGFSGPNYTLTVTTE